MTADERLKSKHLSENQKLTIIGADKMRILSLWTRQTKLKILNYI